MNQQTNQPNLGAPAKTPVKRKRGRPRKDESQAQLTHSLNKPPLRPVMIRTQVDASTALKPSTPTPVVASKGKEPIEVDVDQGINDDHNNDEMVGQVVTGVLESAFDAGYLLTVRVGETNVLMRGLVFKEACVVPITPENDIAPNAKMYQRKDIPIPKQLTTQVAKPAGNSSSKPTENIEEHHQPSQPQTQPLSQQSQPQQEAQEQQQLPIQSAPQNEVQNVLLSQKNPPQNKVQDAIQLPIQNAPQNEVQNVLLSQENPPQNEVQDAILLQGQLDIPLDIERQQVPQEQENLSFHKHQTITLEELDRQNTQLVSSTDGQDVQGPLEGPSFEPVLASVEQSEHNSFLSPVLDGCEKEIAPEPSEPVQTSDEVVVREGNASLVLREPQCDSKEKHGSPRNKSFGESSKPLLKSQKTEHEIMNYPDLQPLNNGISGAQNSEIGTSESTVKIDEIAAIDFPMDVLIQPEPTFTDKETIVLPQVVEPKPEIGGASGFQISMENTDNDEPLSENLSPMEAE